MRIISLDTLRAERRNGTYESKVSYVLDGQAYEVDKKIVNGEMELPVLSKPIGEMLTLGSMANFKELLGKVALDVELGREKVQVLYKPIYDLISDPTLPELLDSKWALTGAVIFAEHMEGQQVRFGTLQAEQGPVARIITYSAAFEYTKQMVEFNHSFEMDILNQSMGEGYNALLNHIHLSPIISFSYPAANKTSFQGEAGEPRWVSVWKCITEGKKQAATKKRQGNILLANSADQMDIEMAIKGFTYSGTTYAPIPGIDTIIYYDGYDVRVGKKEYGYAGVAPGKCFLIRPKRGFKELLKKDLQIEANKGDLTRLVENQMVGYAFRGLFAAVEENVQEIAISP